MMNLAVELNLIYSTCNPSAHFEVMDCRRIAQISLHFDAVLCGFVMPYLSKEDCFQLIKNIHPLLYPGGIIYFSVIEDEYKESGYEISSDGEHTLYVYYHDENYLTNCLKNEGFECIQVIRKDYPKTEGVYATHTVFVVKKQNKDRK